MSGGSCLKIGFQIWREDAEIVGVTFGHHIITCVAVVVAAAIIARSCSDDAAGRIEIVKPWRRWLTTIGCYCLLHSSDNNQ